MKPTLWPDWLETIQAKSSDRGEAGKPESLAEHTWLVLSRLSDLISLRPNLPEVLTTPRLWHLLFWACFLHDFGKVIPSFQTMLRGGERCDQRHEIFSLAFLEWVRDSFPLDDLDLMSAVIVTHHKDASEIRRLYPTLEEGEEDPLVYHILQIDEGTVRGLWRWVSERSNSWIENLSLAKFGVYPVNLQNQEEAISELYGKGTASIRKRLFRFQRYVRHLPSADKLSRIIPLMLRGHMINADHSASAHVEKPHGFRISPKAVLDKRGIDPANLYWHQSRSGCVNGSALLTAPTGSGKTEAALLWAVQQQRGRGGTPRLFYTLPYQASMNAMAIRLREIIGADQVSLQHSRSLLAVYRQLMDRNYLPSDAGSESRRIRNLNQLNYPPVRVFSPYQMLKAMYRLKGYEAQLSDYADALFIFDEIHAYETKRLALIIKTVEYLRSHYEARFFVMSATFPSLIKELLTNALDHPAEITASANLYKSFRRHQLRLLEGDLLEDIWIKNIAEESRSGKSILVVCNLVSRAQKAYEKLKSHLKKENIHIELLHGRFNQRDRLDKEKLIQTRLRQPGSSLEPVLLVATQVVEVSLDIDLDTIYTDPAPLEALIQRFGRINRRRKQKSLAPVHVFSQPADGQNIYDPDLIMSTLEILVRENTKPIDENAVAYWLDEIYSGDIAGRWKKDYQKAASDFETACIQTLAPFQSDPSLEDLFYKAFDGIEVLPLSLSDNYESVKEENPILANELLVPISWGRYFSLANSGQVYPRDRSTPPVVKAGYTSELGLSFDDENIIQEQI